MNWKRIFEILDHSKTIIQENVIKTIFENFLDHLKKMKDNDLKVKKLYHLRKIIRENDKEIINIGSPKQQFMKKWSDIGSTEFFCLTPWLKKLNF